MSFNKGCVFLIGSALGMLFLASHAQGNQCQEYFYKKITTQALTQFLHQRDGKFHTSSEVERYIARNIRQTGERLSKPLDKINLFFSKIESYFEKAQRSPWAVSTLKEVLYEHHVIQESQIPKEYYEHQALLARQRGHGNVEISQRLREEGARVIRRDQKGSLDSWVDYFVHGDSAHYPVGFKYWAFTGMLKLSQYNVETGRFGNRTSDTLAPFAELNREALAKTLDLVIQRLNKRSLEEFKDENIRKALEGLNFGRLYGRVFFQLGVGKEGSFLTNQGRWVVYPRNSDPKTLALALDGRNTGWCTAGKSTAEAHLKEGDFHVYYSLDENGQATIPRLAIRMEGGRIAEVRGVAKDQNLDSQIQRDSVLKDKLIEFGVEGEKYLKRDADMNRLTEIEERNQKGFELSKEDLRFLYELDSKIEGFGYDRDPRIEEIRATRDIKGDLVYILDYTIEREDITLTQEEFLEKSGLVLKSHGKFDSIIKRKFWTLVKPKRVRVHYGDLNFYRVHLSRGVELPEEVMGHLTISEDIRLRSISLPKKIHGVFTIPWGWKMQDVESKLSEDTIIKRPQGTLMI